MKFPKNLAHKFLNLILAIAVLINATVAITYVIQDKDPYQYIVTATLLLIYLEIRESRNDMPVIMTLEDYLEMKDKKEKE